MAKKALFDDPRSAAESMSDAAIPLMGPRIIGNYIDEFVDGEVWRSYLGEPVGPTARQIFSAAVMRQQVDPQ